MNGRTESVTPPKTPALLTHQTSPQDLADVLGDAQQRATEQRLAAERLLEEARRLEERIAVEARAAQECALIAGLVSMSEAARLRVREIETRAELESAQVQERIAQRESCERRVEEARADLEAAKAALAKAERRLDETRQVLERERKAGEKAQAELDAAKASAQATASQPPSSSVVQELSGLQAQLGLSVEAAKRVMDRRAADATRRAAQAL
jgi:outer membrane murein-binding lipoprotein Lpp